MSNPETTRSPVWQIEFIGDGNAVAPNATAAKPCPFPHLYDRGECCGDDPCSNLNRLAPMNQTSVILPAPRDPVPYDEWKWALDQISTALRPHGLVLRVHIMDGSFSVERLPQR